MAKILTETIRIRFSKNDKNLIFELRKLKIKPTTFIRESFRKRIEIELPLLISEEKRKHDLIEILPF